MFTDNMNHQLSSKTTSSPDVNKNINIQCISNTHPDNGNITAHIKNKTNPESQKQINFFFYKNCKTHALRPKNKKTISWQNGQLEKHTGSCELSTSRIKEPRRPIQETSGL
jgi:hypothetical protein